MGIHGIYQEIGPGERVALAKLAVDKFEETGRPLRIAIDVSIWLFQIQAGKGGTNPAVRTFYYRLLRLIAFSIHPVFVFDGPNKPPFKRGKKTSGAHVSSVPDFLAKQLIKQFGFPIHYAPGEAEAECALLQREGIVDAVLSEDVDTLMFGSGVTIRNWSALNKTGKSPTHVNVYDAVKTKSRSSLDREGMILVALLSGGDYVPKGIENCGPKIACEAARAGFGRDLCRIQKTDKAGYEEWRKRLQHEFITNESKFFKTKHKAIKVPDDFPRLDILGYYTHPVVSNKASLDALRRSMKWDQDIDFQGLRTFTHDAFDWIKLEGAKHFVRNLALPLLVRSLRMRGQGEGYTSDNTETIREDEALLVKSIHGKRQHPSTDNTTELRVCYTPIEVVKIDLSKEEPDELPSTQGLAPEGVDSTDVDTDLVDLGDDEDDTGVRKRGPTLFDPTKPARAWVMETYVKVGVPLTTEDWEAGHRQPKRAATSKATTKAAPKAKGGRRAKAAPDPHQLSIQSFGRITKPGAKLSQALSTAQKDAERPPTLSQPPQPARQMPIEIFSSSPVKPLATAIPQQRKEKSLSPVLELPPSVTKRRRRRPLERSHTSPAILDSPIRRPSTPPLASPIQTLDLSYSPVLPSPLPIPAKKARTRAIREPQAARPTRQKSITATTSPSKLRQTTLDAWTPTKSPKTTAPASRPPPPPPPQFQTSRNTIETLDLTLSSPPKPPPPRPTTLANPRRTNPPPSNPRAPLQSISSNASFSSTTSSSSRPISKPATNTPRRTSPRLRKSASTDIETLDMTEMSSPPPPKPSPFALKQSQLPASRNMSAPKSPLPSTQTQTQADSPSAPSLRRSPRIRSPPNSLSTSPTTTTTSTSLPPNRHSSETTTQPSTAAAAASRKLAPSPAATAAAAWKTHATRKTTRKRVIQLRKSGIGTWDFRDIEDIAAQGTAAVTAAGGGSGSGVDAGKGEEVVLKGKERRVWRESMVEVLDLT